MSLNKWDARFTALAALVATWSRDSSTGVGCVIVDPKNRIVSVGFNGYPRGVPDVAHDRDERLRRTIHAEENALLFSGRSVEGCTIYVTHPPCSRCAAKIIQAGITRVVSPIADAAFLERWALDVVSATQMFDEAGVRYA